MSICFSGQDLINPKHNKRINDNSNRHRNDIIHIGRVLPEGIKKDTIQSKRKKRTKEEISSKDNFVKSFKQTFVKRNQNASRFFDIPTYKNDEKVDDRECMDDVIHGMHCPDTHCTTIDVSCGDKQLPLIQLKDQDYVHAHKKHRSKHDGEDKDSYSSEKVCSI